MLSTCLRVLASSLLVAAASTLTLASPEEGAPAKEKQDPQVTHEVLASGEGAMCQQGQAALVHYTGTLKDGTKFDSSRDRKDPFVVLVGTGRVIPGWDQTLVKMRVGDRWKVTIPWQLAYGERGSPPVIPSKADLTFDMEVLELVEPDVEVVKAGEGEALADGEFCEMHLTASLAADGKVWTDTRKNPDPALLRVGAVSGITGLDMSLMRMRVGDHWKISVPANLALGKRADPKNGIPENADHVFEVQVLRVVRPTVELVEDANGATPKRGQRVQMHYTGTLTDGKKFDSSRDRGQPFSFVLGVGQVIPGWDIVVADMKVGQKVKATIPWQLAYGAQGRPPSIPKKADLIFEMELLGIQ